MSRQVGVVHRQTARTANPCIVAWYARQPDLDQSMVPWIVLFHKVSQPLGRATESFVWLVAGGLPGLPSCPPELFAHFCCKVPHAYLGVLPTQCVNAWQGLRSEVEVGRRDYRQRRCLGRRLQLPPLPSCMALAAEHHASCEISMSHQGVDSVPRECSQRELPLGWVFIWGNENGRVIFICIFGF